jgi:hypothetical protein
MVSETRAVQEVYPQSHLSERTAHLLLYVADDSHRNNSQEMIL